MPDFNVSIPTAEELSPFGDPIRDVVKDVVPDVTPESTGVKIDIKPTKIRNFRWRPQNGKSIELAVCGFC